MGKIENRTISNSNHIIGRTDWDYAAVKAINPNLTYHKCNEILRDEFYSNEPWNYKNCEKHTIFMSQGSYPIKGLHQAIEAISIIKRRYPKLILKISGQNIFSTDSFYNKVKISSYAKYINHLIRKYDLTENVQFLGTLNVNQIIQEYLQSNVYLMASSIENSPNSIGEAMILGVPIVSSFVGGIPNFIEHNTDGYLYQFDSPYMIAHYIQKTFEESGNIQLRLMNTREKAMKIFDSVQNSTEMIQIYNNIIKNR